MAPVVKLSIAMTLLAFLSFGLVLIALHFKSRLLFLIGAVGCSAGILVGVVSIFITIFVYLRRPP